MRCRKLVVLAAAILIPTLADVGSADQRVTVPNGPVACNSACRWWMALGERPAADQPHEAAAAAPGAAAPVATPAHAPAVVMAARVAAHHRPVAATTRTAGSREPTGPVRTAVARAEPPLPPHHAAAPAAEPPVPAAPLLTVEAAAPDPVAVVRDASADDAGAASPIAVTEDRTERAAVVGTPDPVPPSVAVSVQTEQALLTPRRARNGLMAGALLCAVALSLRRASRARVRVPIDRRNEPPLLDAFKAGRRAEIPRG